MPKLKSKKYWGKFFPEYELRRRETGFKCVLGWEGNLKYTLYSSLLPSTSWDPVLIFSSSKNSTKSPNIHHGGVFNLEFSPDGRQLVAACERKAIMVFDPLTRKKIHDVGHAHSNCVNCIKFLDNRVFASCSDDKTVALWDIRNLKRKIVRLNGHNNWVKNIEYSSEDSLLVTSGFDGRILGWNINRYTENSLQFTELFSMQGLMRMRLTPDLSKLIICTTGGYMVLVHDLSLKDLHTDFKDFKPHMYRLMQLTNYQIPQPASFAKLLCAKRNRVEFISDFPNGNDAELIHSLQVHPFGWSALSRNTSTDNTSEWTCVHDIQDMEPEVMNEMREKLREIKDPDSSNEGGSFYMNSSRAPQNEVSPFNSDNEDIGVAASASDSMSPRIEIVLRSNNNQANHDDEDDIDEDDEDDMDTQEDLEEERIGYGSIFYRTGEQAGLNLQLRFTSRDAFEALEHIEIRRENDNLNEPGPSDEQAGSSNMRINVSGGSDDENRSEFTLRRSRRLQSRNENRTARVTPPEDQSSYYRNAFVVRTGLNNHRAVLILPRDHHRLNEYNSVDKNNVVKSLPRLTNYIEEPNKGRGFIKELCFSSDGRLICSPFDCGVRLMMFDEKCSELSHCVKQTPQQLCAVSTNICHTGCVVSTKFSPVDLLLVSGCLNGKIVWHQPVI